MIISFFYSQYDDIRNHLSKDLFRDNERHTYRDAHQYLVPVHLRGGACFLNCNFLLIGDVHLYFWFLCITMYKVHSTLFDSLWFCFIIWPIGNHQPFNGITLQEKEGRKVKEHIETFSVKKNNICDKVVTFFERCYVLWPYRKKIVLLLKKPSLMVIIPRFTEGSHNLSPQEVTFTEESVYAEVVPDTSTDMKLYIQHHNCVPSI